MKYTYHIHGMTCNGCRSHVEEILSKVKGVSNVSVNIKNEEATIQMETHMSIETFQEALKSDGGSYSIHNLGEKPHHSEVKNEEKPKGKGTGTFYCPMHCEGSGSDEAGKCPVCGMDYVKNENHKADGHQHDNHEGHNH